MQTFGWNLLQFTRSVDNLHEDVIDGMKGLVSDYFLRKEGIGACYFCIHRGGGKFDGNVEALRTVWSSDPAAEGRSMRRFISGNDTGSPSLRALAYNEERWMWVMAKAEVDTKNPFVGPTLNEAPEGSLEDHWSADKQDDDANLPGYLSMHAKPCRTLVALPLSQNEKKLGVLVIEFDRRIPCTPGARQEASLIAKALARVLALQDAMDAKQTGTRKAFSELKNLVLNSSSSVDPPTIFFAAPGTSDEAVTNIIKDTIVQEYSDQLRLIAWDQMAAPGQITDQIVDEISRCRYGICYLSQITESTNEDPAPRRYLDNSNVLIEAGMLYALRHSPFSPTLAWIPVREADALSVDKPFDFVAERMIEVPRGADGLLIQEVFVAELRVRIDAILV